MRRAQARTRRDAGRGPPKARGRTRSHGRGARLGGRVSAGHRRAGVGACLARVPRPRHWPQSLLSRPRRHGDLASFLGPTRLSGRRANYVYTYIYTPRVISPFSGPRLSGRRANYLYTYVYTRPAPVAFQIDSMGAIIGPGLRLIANGFETVVEEMLQVCIYHLVAFTLPNTEAFRVRSLRGSPRVFKQRVTKGSSKP